MFACGAVFAQDAMAQSFEVDGVKYNKTSETTCEITWYSAQTSNGSHYRGKFVIPEAVEYDGVTYTVTGIDERTFHDCQNIQWVTIPSTVTYIGDEAFYNCGVTKIEIPESVTTIGSEAFYLCSSLQSADILGDVSYIGKKAFSVCHELSVVRIVGNVEALSEEMFYNCSDLVMVTLPNSLKTIGDRAFYSCENFISIDMPEGLTSIGEMAFYGCDKLLLDGVPSSVTSIGYGAFQSCDGIKRFDSLGQITEIDGLFKDCVNLSYVNITGKVKSITNGAFENCESLKSLLLPWTIEHIDDYVFRGTRLLNLGSIVINQTTIEIGPMSNDIVSGIENTFVKVSGNMFYPEKGMVLCTGLLPEEYYTLSYGFVYGGGKTTIVDDKEYKTGGMMLGIYEDFISPTEIKCYGKYNEYDAKVLFTSIEIERGYPDEFVASVEGDTLYVSGLEPKTGYFVTYRVSVEGKDFEVKKGFVTHEVEFTTLPAKATSNTVALICAETNLPDTVGGTGFEWRRYDAPEEMPSSTAACPVIDGVLTGSLNNLSPSTYYKFRPYYKAESGKMFYGEWVAFITADAYVYFDPTVRTYAATGVTETTADVSATAVQGSDPVTEQGFEYWPTATRAAAMRVKAAAAPQGVQTVTATGQVMTATLEGLQPGTGYTFRAYVKTAKGTTYGGEQTFSTLTATGLSVVPSAGDAVEIARYDAVGRKIDAPVRGLNIVVMSDGSVRKVIVK